LHDESGHRDREGTYRKVSQRFWWPGMAKDVAEFVRTCEKCQLRATGRFPDELHATFGSSLFHKVCMDIVHMTAGVDQKKYLVLARDDFSGWVEGRGLTKATSEKVADFVYQELISRFGCPRKIKVDGGPEDKGFTERLCKRYPIDRKVVSAYHSQANGLIERGHQPVVDALQKMSKTPREWPKQLHSVLRADRISICRSTGKAPFDLVFGWQCVLPVELTLTSWGSILWGDINSTEDLLEARARQLEMREEDMLDAAEKLVESRAENKRYFDIHSRKRHASQALLIGDLVLLHNTQLDKHWSDKLANRWRGPYRINDISAV
jgi:hypothetical protein